MPVIHDHIIGSTYPEAQRFSQSKRSFGSNVYSPDRLLDSD